MEIPICCTRTDVTRHCKSTPTIQLEMRGSKIVGEYDQEILQSQTADKIVL